MTTHSVCIASTQSGRTMARLGLLIRRAGSWGAITTLLALAGCQPGPIDLHFHKSVGEVPVYVEHGRLSAAGAERLPGDVRVDLERLADAVSALPTERPKTIQTSQTGAAVVAWGQPEGVYIWRDWRDAHRIDHLPEYTNVRFVGDHHIIVSHRGHPPWGLVDLRQPSVVHPMETIPAVVDVAADGRWGAVDVHERLWTGMLEVGVPPQNGQRVDLPGGVADVLSVRDGAFMVVGLVTREVLVLDSATLQPVMVEDVRGGRLLRCGSAGVLILEGHHGHLVTVSEAGEPAATQVDVPRSERPFRPSPSGQFYLTWRNLLWPPSAVEANVRRTPKAGRDVPTPEVAGLSIAGWLAWEDG